MRKRTDKAVHNKHVNKYNVKHYNKTIKTMHIQGDDGIG